MSSIKANVDALLSSSNIDNLQNAGEMVKEALLKTKGVVSVSTSWNMDKRVYNLNIDETKALEYGLRRADIIQQLKSAIRGLPIATFPRENSIDYTVRVWLTKNQIDNFETILNMLIDTPKGKVPLNKFAKLSSNFEPTLITREGLEYTLEVYGNREKSAISHIMADFEKHLEKVELPRDVELEQIGDIKQFKALC